MPLTDATLNSMADHLGTLATHVSLHTADPGTTGASEVTGGTYARQLVAWDAAANGDLSLQGTETFNVPAGVTVTHFGLWSAATGGTFRGGGALSASETFTSAGTYNLTDITISGT